MIQNQTTIFDMMYSKYKITKTIRLIELFSGYGSQYLALKYLGADVQHYKICEWAVKSIQAYNDLQIQNYIDYSENLSDDEVLDNLIEGGVSINYNEPATRNQLKRQNYRKIYNNIIATNNLVNIQNAKGKDFEIINKDKYEYIMTYSFPCQDLSLAGKRAGMSDTSTRSGMLWEVERILNELKELNQLPQVLLMENVPQVHGTNNIEHFNKWQLALEQLGYKNYFQDLIATDFGIPQTRNRCFMISILGDYSYTFPKTIPLKLKLKDLLENEVDEKYYLSDKQLKDIQKWNSYEKPLDNMEKIASSNISPTLTTRSGAYAAGMILLKETKNYIQWKEKGKLDIDCRTAKEDKISLTITTTSKAKVLLKNELCNKLIEENKVQEYDVIKHSYSNSRLDSWKERGVESNNISPTLTTRPDTLGVCIKNNTKKGYLEATDGDGIDISSRMEHHRDNVQKDKIQTLTTSGGNDRGVLLNDLRIRKLTPLECFRLMGVKDEDYYKIAKSQSDTSLYHLAGDSIVVNVLMAIFKEML